MRRIGIVILLIGVAIGVFAQPRLREPEISFGFHAGVQAASVDFYPTIPTMTPLTKACTLAPNGGFIFRYSKHKHCALQIELNYQQRGWRESAAGNDTVSPINYSRRLHYIELPMLMHVYVGKKAFRAYITAGPQIGYCFYDDMGKGTRQTAEVHQYSEITHRFDWGVGGGLGMLVNTPKAGTYQLEARFMYSLGTLYASTATDYFRKSHAMTLSINVGWLWNFKPANKRQQRTQAL